MSKRMKHSKTVKIRFTNPEYQAVKIIQNHTLCQIWNYIQFWEIPEDVKQEIKREITRYV